MKILHIINSLETGGAEKLVYQIFKKMNAIPNVECCILSLKELSDSDYIHDDKIYTLNIKNIYGLLAVKKLYSFLNKKEFDVIHTHLFPTQYYVSFFYKLQSIKKRPCLITTEHSTNNKRRYKVFRLLERFIYCRYDKIILISEIAEQKIRNHIGDTEKFVVIPNGINLDLFSDVKEYDKKEFGLLDDDFIITMVAGFRDAKDQDTLIKSIALLDSNFKLLLVGDGKRRNHLELLINKLHLNDRVKLLGIRKDVPKILKTSDVVVMSSHYEGLSLSSIEGMAARKPFVASNVDGLRQVVEGVGILFEHGDSNQLSKIILELYGNKTYYNEVAESCFLHSKKYSIGTLVDKYLNVYRNCIK